jgi:toxin-antitoxin system PIN domain toxin
VIAVDSNVLIYAHRLESEFHVDANSAVRHLAESASSWAIPWPCLHEFYSVVTNTRSSARPTTPAEALVQIRAWRASPSILLLGEGHDHLEILHRLIERARVVGPMIHDAKIAAICISHGVRELLTLDRDFSRFPEITIRSVIA